MTGPSQPRRRQRGQIEKLPSGALRVKVYAGIDPISKRRLHLSETVPPGPRQARLAEEARTRLQNQLDEKRSPRSRATVGQLIDKYLTVLQADPSTLRGYQSKIRTHIRPLLGSVPLTRLDIEVLDSFYAELRRCRDHCDGKPAVQHRTKSDHRCDEHSGIPCSPADPQGCRACRRACKAHVCSGLSDSTVRQIHWIISGALDRAVVWKWIAVNPAEHADKPSLPHPDPEPPTADEAARLVGEAWTMSPDWGTYIWTKMTTGARRGEMCALRWLHLDLDKELITIRRTLSCDEEGELIEKDTKTHQQRRVVLDPETASVLRDHRDRVRLRLAEQNEDLDGGAFVFSPVPDGSKPLLPDTASHRYQRMAERLGIETTLKNLRHYSATELISAGVDVRTVAGRLGHGGGGATTLRVYTAWSSEADQRAAATVSGRMPARPVVIRTNPQDTDATPPQTGLAQTDQPYQRIAADLRGAIDSGILRPGDPLPTEKALAERYGVAASTAHRAVALLVAVGQVTALRGKRAVVAVAGQVVGGDEIASVTELRP
jgi:integrase